MLNARHAEDIGRKLVVLIAPAALPLASLSLAPLPLASQRTQRTSGSLRAERQLGSFPFRRAIAPLATCEQFSAAQFDR